MRRYEAIRLALAQIRAQKLKSFFAVLGVVIGVMFLMTVASVVEGMDRYMEEDFARTLYGVNTLTVRRTPQIDVDADPDAWREYRRRPRLRHEDAEAIRRALSVDARVAVASGGSGQRLRFASTEVTNVQLVAASAEIFEIRNYRVAHGRAFTPPEDRAGAPVLVLGSDVAEAAFGALDPVGRTVKIGNLPFRVIGVLESRGSLFGISLDNIALVPARSPAARFVAAPGYVDEILVRTEEVASMHQARLDVEATMRVRHRLRPTVDNDFAIETAEESMSFWTRISTILMIAFPGLVGIALVVGGIVIMNIMLVSVAERTHEIGVRKAVGARRRDIHAQILGETTILSAAGAAIGIGIGSVLARVVSALSPLPVDIAPIWMIVAVAVSMGVGIVAGLYPASRAARLDPVAALRAE